MVLIHNRGLKPTNKFNILHFSILQIHATSDWDTRTTARNWHLSQSEVLISCFRDSHATHSCSRDTHAAVTARTHDPFMEVAPRPKNFKGRCQMHTEEGECILFFPITVYMSFDQFRGNLHDFFVMLGEGGGRGLLWALI